MISAYLNGLFGIVLALCAGMFAAGMRAGGRSQRGSAADRTAGLISLALVILLVGGTMPLARQHGPLITLIAACFGMALSVGLLGGLMAGRARQAGKPLFGTGTFVTFLLIAGLLGYSHSQVKKITDAVQELGIDSSAAKYDPVADKNCSENLKSLYTAFELYAESNSSLPPEKWLEDDELKSKIVKDEWEHCPAVSNRHDEKYGYAYNIALAGKTLKGKLKDLPDAATTPLLYDSTDLTKNAHDAVASLPRPGRHNGMNYILYCDGTVKAAAPK